ncbi:hypothetical protein QN277_022744 [Acacia crassicarpa]|uniref:Protein kinase domain-containing protein n=1 Tax=Acacia crassicarpa TaxID=499986 RepID=A0AAE1JKC0_9FABA|nr:hypothetical protein QN277_022744 [Acacia crassicarpa]
MRHNLAGLWISLLAIFTTAVHCRTDSQDVSALNGMYSSLTSHSQLEGWKSSGGDPCGDSWKGIKCSGSSVTKINLSGLGLTGSMGYQLANMASVTHFDLSKNNLNGDLPYQLPPNSRHIDLSKNSFTGVVPFSISEMTNLNTLNLAHNQLNNQLGDMFGKLTKLKQMDLSFNSLSGNLPQSFKSLSGLKKLDLQNNQLSGSIKVLGNLPLEELNVENNKFSGWIPAELKNISSLQTGGNSWSTPPPPPPEKGIGKPAVIGIVLGSIAFVLLVVSVIVAVVKKRSSLPPLRFLDEELNHHRSPTPLASQELSNNVSEFKPSDSALIDIKALPEVPSSSARSSASDCVQTLDDNEITNRLNAARSISIRVVHHFPFADLRAATGNFASSRLIGKGSIGCVYRAKYADGQVLAVKKLDSTKFLGSSPEEFSQIISKISHVHHPNIAKLVGYSSEQGDNMLVYEYFRNGSLHKFLHVSDDFSKPLTWNTRVKIALGTAQAIAYLHESCSPPIVHKNIKSSNIVLDSEFNPHLSDCGLASFHQRPSQNLGAGYKAPECSVPEAYTLKSDVYSFGVVMLELLTGRQPLDRSKPISEQFLVLWATPQLHDIVSLSNMVDPSLRGLYPPKSLSMLADIIAFCVRPEPKFRPQMSEVVVSLLRLVEHSNMNMREDLDLGMDDNDD